MRSILPVIVVLLLTSCGMAQVKDTLYNALGYLNIPNNPDSVRYSKDYYFNEGIYLDYTDFRKGNAIPRAYLLTKVEKNQLDFYNKVIEDADTLVVRVGTGIKLVPVDCVFCYVQNNVVYLNVEGTFCRIAVFGSVSHFIGTISVEAFRNTDSPFYDPYQNAGGSTITGTPLKAKETRQFLFDFYSGRTVLATAESVDEILKRDSVLYNEYSALKKRLRKKKMTYFLKKYNELHPAYFPKY